MTLLIVLIGTLIISVVLDIVFDLDTFVVRGLASIILFFYLLLIPVSRYCNRIDLNNYINYVERYQQLKNSNKIDNIENAALSNKYVDWDTKIETYKKQNETALDILIPDDILNKALKKRDEITE